MDAAFRPGTDGGRRRGLPLVSVRAVLRGAGSCALLLLALQTYPAGASVLYRCTGAHGEAAYVSHTQGFAHCVKVGSWPAPPAHALRKSAKSVHAPTAVATRKPAKPAKAPVAATTRQSPRPVADSPVVKVTPLGMSDSTRVRALAPAVWQPLPVAAMQTLGSQLLARLLGVALPRTATAREAQLPTPTVAHPAAPVAARIPLKLADDRPPKPPRHGAVYRVVKQDGSVLYTNIASLAKGHHAKKLFTYIVRCYACNVHSKIDWRTVPLHLAAFRHDIRAAAKLTGVAPALLRAVIHAESGFNPWALSYKGAQGLMQLMPATASDLGVNDAFDPAENISGGARYLAMLLHKYHGDVKLAAAAYNAGPNAVAEYDGVPPYAETQVYVKRVALLFRRYRKALAAAGPTVTAAHMN